MKRGMNVLVSLMVLAMAAGATQGAVKPITESLNLPTIWEQAGPQEQLKALRVAEVDALRLLVERIYGVYLDSDTTVYDLVLADDEVRAGVTRTIKGVATTEDPEYLDDGIVQVVRAVKLRQVLRTITEKVTKKKILGRMITVERLRKVEVENRDKVIDVMGNGALPGSKGLRKIQAKRAGEIDAYRKLTERLMGVRVTSKTTVKDFVLESDVIRARASQLIKGAKPVAITYLPDNSCEVKMQIKVADIFRIIRKYSKEDQELIKVEKEYAAATFTETGLGAPRPIKDEAIAEACAPTSEIQAVDGVYQETEIIIKQYVGQGIVIE